ncbi:MAG: transcription elongation factor GreA [Anaerolineales bacterium]|jgi:transcription elongation factor GreA
MKKQEFRLTPEGAEKMKAELEHLKGDKRIELAKRLRHAISMGDLSENADYIAAKEDQAFLEGKIQELETILRNSVIIEKSENGVIDIGSHVVIEEDGQTFHYHLVGVKEADPRNGKISHESPIGRALLGKAVGDKAVAETPVGEITMQILEIS